MGLLDLFDLFSIYFKASLPLPFPLRPLPAPAQRFRFGRQLREVGKILWNLRLDGQAAGVKWCLTISRR